MNTSEQSKTIIRKLNVSIRSRENDTDFDTIRATLAGLAERYAAEIYGTTLASLDPRLFMLLNRIRESRGHLVDNDAFDLIDLGIAALDLRAPEDR